jgi:hypothetical protein
MSNLITVKPPISFRLFCTMVEKIVVSHYKIESLEPGFLTSLCHNGSTPMPDRDSGESPKLQSVFGVIFPEKPAA